MPSRPGPISLVHSDFSRQIVENLPGVHQSFSWRFCQTTLTSSVALTWTQPSRSALAFRILSLNFWNLRAVFQEHFFLSRKVKMIITEPLVPSGTGQLKSSKQLLYLVLVKSRSDDWWPELNIVFFFKRWVWALSFTHHMDAFLSLLCQRLPGSHSVAGWTESSTITSALDSRNGCFCDPVNFRPHVSIKLDPQ